MRRARIVLVVVLAASPSVASAEDWPTWRYDAGRGAASPERLPDGLDVEWVRRGEPLTPAWTEDSRLWFDASYEPVVAGNRMFVASNRNDSVTAVDIETGRTLWRYYADGPVRFAPVATRQEIYFGADDGCFYSVAAGSGELRWKFRVPNGRKVLVFLGITTRSDRPSPRTA